MSKQPMTISVIICCYRDDRWEDLCAAISSAQEQLPPVDEIVVVVDHNRALKARIEARFSKLVVVENREERGLSGARNTGIAVAHGALLAFLDDDAVADPYMLAHLRNSCEAPKVLGACARIEPDWLDARPSWFPSEFLWVVGCTYRGLTPGPVRNLLGAAMCIHRKVFDTVGGFDRRLGRNHTKLPLGCEETELCIRASRSIVGARFVYEPAAMCRHKIPASRLTLRYFAFRCYAEGLSKADLAVLGRSTKSFSTERIYVLRALSSGVARSIADWIYGQDRKALSRPVAITIGLACAAAGYLVGRSRLPASSPEAPVRAKSANDPVHDISGTVH
jgi:glucosyl-dolichyl phosphate glucuronosyltransferase